MKYVTCIIAFFYPDRKCFDATSIDGSSFFEDVSYDMQALSGEGIEVVPSIGSVVVLKLDDDNNAEVYKYYKTRKRYNVSEGDEPIELTYYDNGYKTKLPLPGDHSMSSPDGAILAALAGPIAKIGATPMAQMLFVGLENFVRLIAQNFELVSGAMRVFSTSDDGKTITKFCFATSDISITKGALDNNQFADYCNYVIEVSDGGFNLLAGAIDEETGKRVNNILLNIIPGDGFYFATSSDFTSKKDQAEFYLSSQGMIEEVLYNTTGKQVYGRSITTTSDDKVFVNEIIDGNFTRNITGNFEEKVGGKTKQYHHDFAMGSDIGVNIESELFRTNSSVVKLNPRENPYTGGE